MANPSEVQICNVGLIALGVNPILSLSDNSKAARECKAIYADKRDELLRNHDWSFAVHRTVLAPDVAAPAFEYTYQFTQPADSLRLVSVTDALRNDLVYILEGGKILCDYDTIYVRYVQQVTDPIKMDTSFRQTLSMVIAKELAIPLTASPGKKAAMEEAYEVALASGKFAGSSESYPVELITDDWINSRV